MEHLRRQNPSNPSIPVYRQTHSGDKRCAEGPRSLFHLKGIRMACQTLVGSVFALTLALAFNAIAAEPPSRSPRQRQLTEQAVRAVDQAIERGSQHTSPPHRMLTSLAKFWGRVFAAVYPEEDALRRAGVPSDVGQERVAWGNRRQVSVEEAV